MTTSKQEGELIRLNRIELILGVFVAIIAICGAVGSWFVLPYRVGQLEKSFGEMREEISTVRYNGDQNRELLIRMDERLKSVQRALKIPVEKEDPK